MRVTDNGVPPLSSTNSFTVVVREVNVAPVLGSIPNQLLVLGDTLTLTNVVTDADIPANRFTFQLVTAPDGMNIAASNGVLSWTPLSAQTPSTNPVVVRVTDNGSPPRSDETSFSAVVIPLPSLMIRKSGFDAVVLSWPALASEAGFDLVSTTNLNPPLAWTAVTNLPATVNGAAAVTNTAHENLQIFQLRRR